MAYFQILLLVLFFFWAQIGEATEEQPKKTGILDGINHSVANSAGNSISFGKYLSIDKDQVAEVVYRLLQGCERVVADEGKLILYKVVGLNGLLLDTTNVERKRNIDLADALLEGIGEIIHRANVAGTIGLNIQREFEDMGTTISDGLNNFAEAVSDAFTFIPNPLPICNIMEVVTETCICEAQHRPKTQKKTLVVEARQVPPPSDVLGIQAGLESAAEYFNSALYGPVSPEPDRDRENICLPGHECLRRGCFTPDPTVNERIRATLMAELPDIIAAIQAFWNVKKETGRQQTDDDKATLGAVIWERGGKIIGTGTFGLKPSPEPPVTHAEVRKFPNEWLYSKRGMVKIDKDRNSDKVRDIRAGERVHVVEVAELDGQIRGRIAPSLKWEAGGWVALMNPAGGVLYVSRPPLLKDELMETGAKWVVIRRCQAREAYTLESPPTRNVEIGEILTIDAEVVELESGEVRARFAATPDNPVVGYFTLATYRDDGKLKGINVRRYFEDVEAVDERLSESAEIASPMTGSLNLSTTQLSIVVPSLVLLSYSLGTLAIYLNRQHVQKRIMYSSSTPLLV